MDRSRSATGTRQGRVVVNELAHYGVKGMKWGVHHDKPSGDSSSGAPARSSADATEASRAINKAGSAGGLHVLSNQELQRAITRMNLENQYRNLTATPHKSELDRGLQTAEKLLKIGGTVEKARKFLETPTGKAVKTGLSGAFAAATAYATGGASAAAGAGASVVIRRASNHYTNVGN
jgi:hypothetical protein